MRGRGLFRYFGLVALAYVIATVGAGLTDYLTRLQLSNTTNLLLSGGVGLATAMGVAAVDLAKPREKKEHVVSAAAPGSATYVPPGVTPTPYQTPPYHLPGVPPAPPRKRGAAGIVVGAVVLLALCGGGGYALTTGVTWAAGKLSDIFTPPWLDKTKDPGVERLAEQASTTVGPLTVTVRSVRVNDQVTMIEINARNTGPDTLRLPTMTAQLTIPGATFEADPFAGDTSIDVPPNSESFGTVVFDGVLPAGPAGIVLHFTQIFGGFDSPRSISVPISVT